MRRLFRSFGVIVLSVAGTIVLAGTQSMTPLVALTATALIMGGTGHPLTTPQDSPEFINGYTTDANNDYIMLTGFCGAGSCTPTAVGTPEQFMPVSGTMPFDQSVGQGVSNLGQAIDAQPAGESIVVFGYSQSARIASIEKGNLAAAGSTLPISFVLIGNPNRPNGGVLQRFEGLEIPILGVTFDGATPTNTDFKTVDITRQYDGWSDFPTNPLNPFATANAVAGIQYLHSDYQSVGLGDALYQGSYGDTDYYMIPSQRLPLLIPLEQAGVPSPVVTIIDAPARVLVESGYNRTISPGEPTKASIMYFPNPAKTGVNFIVAIPTGLDDGAQEAANIRPFGTPPIDQRSPYGVGGPPVNAGSFDSTGAPISPASAPASTAPLPNTQPIAAKQGPGLPVGAAACGQAVTAAAAGPGREAACARRHHTADHRAGTAGRGRGSGPAGDSDEAAVVEAGRGGQSRTRACRTAETGACRPPSARAAPGTDPPEVRAAEAGPTRAGTGSCTTADADRPTGGPGIRSAGHPGGTADCSAH